GGRRGSHGSVACPSGTASILPSCPPRICRGAPRRAARGAQPAAAADGCSCTAGSVIAKQLPTPASVSTVRVPSKLCSTRWRAAETRRIPLQRDAALLGEVQAARRCAQAMLEERLDVGHHGRDLEGAGVRRAGLPPLDAHLADEAGGLPGPADGGHGGLDELA